MKNQTEFSKKILEEKDIEIKPVSSEEYPQKAYRPRNSILDLSKTKATGFNIPTWKEALDAFLAEIN